MFVVAFGMQWFTDFVLMLAGIIFKAAWWFFTEFYSWFFEHLSAMIMDVLSSAGLNLDLSIATTTFAYLNYFMPLNETLAMLTMLFIFWCSLFVLKIILKLIPWIY